MEIGTISGIKKDDGRIICTVDFGADDAITAVLYGAASQNEYPLIDDEVAVNRSEDENIIVAVFRPVPDELESGERIMYGRDADGATVSSVKLSNNGNVEITGEVESAGAVNIGDASDHVAMAQKVDDLWALFNSLFTNWVPVPQDGGAALKTAFTSAFPPPGPQSVASTNLKAD